MLASLRLLCRGALLFLRQPRRGATARNIALGLLLLPLVGCGGRASLTMATTTSTYDSGLLDALLPPFERANNVEVKVVAVGSGEALELGRRGDADVVLAHSPDQEAAFVAEGYGSDRQAVMHNDFVLVGPISDPAGVKGMKDAAQAFSRIAGAKAAFVSRGDNSGAHNKENEIWGIAGLSREVETGDPWYLSAGQGMGETLRIAHEKRAYTLADRGTYLTYRDGLALAILVEGDEVLLNPYHIMAVNADKVKGVNYELAKKLIEFMTSAQGQEIIADFGVDRFGQALFFPDAVPGQR